MVSKKQLVAHSNVLALFTFHRLLSALAVNNLDKDFSFWSILKRPFDVCSFSKGIVVYLSIYLVFITAKQYQC